MPTAITGVVRPVALEQLRALSELLGGEVVAVERDEGGTRRMWRLTVMEERDGGRQRRDLAPMQTFDFKASDRLNFLAWTLGRDPSLPRLTRMDGRRALRLMHEIAEATGLVTGLDLHSPSERLEEIRRVDDFLTAGITSYETYRKDFR